MYTNYIVIGLWRYGRAIEHYKVFKVKKARGLEQNPDLFWDVFLKKYHQYIVSIAKFQVFVNQLKISTPEGEEWINSHHLPLPSSKAFQGKRKLNTQGGILSACFVFVYSLLLFMEM